MKKPLVVVVQGKPLKNVRQGLTKYSNFSYPSAISTTYAHILNRSTFDVILLTYIKAQFFSTQKNYQNLPLGKYKVNPNID